MINPTLTTRPDHRWPQGAVGRRHTRIVKNARLYLATTNGEVVKIGWGDVCLEHWHLLQHIAEDGLVLIAYSSTYGTRLAWYDQAETADTTFEDLIPTLALAVDRVHAVLLNFSDGGRHSLGAVRLDALDRDATRAWLAARLTELAE